MGWFFIAFVYVAALIVWNNIKTGNGSSLDFDDDEYWEKRMRNLIIYR